MKKLLTAVISLALLLAANQAVAVESRQPALGDKRVVGLLHWSIYELPGCAGTVFGPRLVLTVGHCLSHETTDGKRPSRNVLPPVEGEIPDSRTIWITYPGETVVNGSERKVAAGIAQFFTDRFADGGCNENYTVCRAPEFDFGVIVLDRDLPYAPIKLATAEQVQQWLDAKIQASVIGLGAISYEDFFNINGAAKQRQPMKVAINLLPKIGDYALTPNEKDAGNLAAGFKFINGINPGGIISGSPVFYEESGNSYYLGALSSVEGASIASAPNDPIWQDQYWKNNAGGKIYLASYFNQALDKANKYLEKRLAIEAEAKAKAEAKRKITIVCVKGKVSKKISGVKPKCPKGFIKR